MCGKLQFAVVAEPNRLHTVQSGREVYCLTMLRNPGKCRSVALLALLLMVGPLQAQVLYACDMMGATLQSCCCDDIEGVPSGSVDSEPADPCCERVVEIRSDPDSVEVVKSLELRSDVDPPAASLVHPLAVFPLSANSGPIEYARDATALEVGRLIYLTTQRLRL